MKRSECIAMLHPELEDKVVVTIMGACAQELYDLGHRENFFYLQHAMGLASSIGLGLALRGFFHPAAQRTMLWDIQHASRTRSMTEAIRDPERRALVQRVLDRFDAVLAPSWGRFRAQVVHTDLTTDNALVDERGRITGIVDFGDASHTALIVDLAGVLDAPAPGRLFRRAAVRS